MNMGSFNHTIPRAVNNLNGDTLNSSLSPVSLDNSGLFYKVDTFVNGYCKKLCYLDSGQIRLAEKLFDGVIYECESCVIHNSIKIDIHESHKMILKYNLIKVDIQCKYNNTATNKVIKKQYTVYTTKYDSLESIYFEDCIDIPAVCIKQKYITKYLGSIDHIEYKDTEYYQFINGILVNSFTKSVYN